MSRTHLYATCIVLRLPSASFASNPISTTDILSFKSHVKLLNVLTLLDLLHYHNNLLPWDIFLPQSNLCTRCSQSNKLIARRYARTCDRLCFLASATKDWNSLPNFITSLISKSIFKNTCFKHKVKNYL